jgi:hypothetical protein
MLRNIAKQLSKFNFSSEVQKTTTKSTSGADLTYYKDGQLTTRSAIILKKQ